MGTQQILMIVLSVIVVGAAVAVGIEMFDTQSNNQARNAISLDLLQHAVQAQAWYRTPKIMGGGGYEIDATDIPDIAKFINQEAGATSEFENPNGSFVFSLAPDDEVQIIGTARSNPNIVITAIVDLTGQKHDIDDYDRGIKIIFN